MQKALCTVHALVWGAPALAGILGVGLYLSVRLSFVQLRLLPRALRDFFQKLRPGSSGSGSSQLQALCTALAATVGTGNLVGVAGAICLGGPGAIFWMWLCALVGMATKFTEVILAVHYRVPGQEGFTGGPMYVITRGMGRRYGALAKLYCLFGVIASFGVGNGAQINAAVCGVEQLLYALGKTPGRGLHLILGCFLGVGVTVLLLGGARKIAKAAQLLVPLAALGYLVLCAGVLFSHPGRIPVAFAAIVQGAFSPRAITGGMLGSAFQALRVGCSRGVFTNEAGMGTAAIAHAAAQVEQPGEQGLMGIVEVFLDTIVMCTLTALVILVSGVPIPFGTDAGAELTIRAFEAQYDRWAGISLGLILVLLAVATVLGWGLYGARCAEFLFGRNAWRWFAAAQGIAAAFSAVTDTASVWLLSETVNGLMAIPNLVSLAVLAPQAVRLTKAYTDSIENGPARADGGTYADIHQRKPV